MADCTGTIYHRPCERNSKSSHLSSIVGSTPPSSFYLVILRGTLGGKHSMGRTFSGWKGSWDKGGINSIRDDTEGEPLGLFLPNFGPNAGKRCLMGVGAPFHPTSLKQFATPHPHPKSFSVLPGSSILVLNVLNSFRRWAGFEKWSLVYYWFWPQGQQNCICVYTFIGPIYNFRLEVGWEIF